MNQKEIEKIVRQEKKILFKKMCLEWSFFIISCFVIWMVVRAVIESAVNLAFNAEQDQIAVTKIIITLLLFIVAIAIGYLYNRKLSKKLDELWEQKKRFF